MTMSWDQDMSAGVARVDDDHRQAVLTHDPAAFGSDLQGAE